MSLSRFRQTSHEIDGDGFPTGCGNGEGLEESSRCKRGWFVDLAAVTCLDVGSDISSHAWPPHVACENFQGSVFALVSRIFGIVCFVQELAFEVFVIWKTQTVSEIPKSITEFLGLHAFVAGITEEVIVDVGCADCVKVIGEGDVGCGTSIIWSFSGSCCDSQKRCVCLVVWSA